MIGENDINNGTNYSVWSANIKTIMSTLSAESAAYVGTQLPFSTSPDMTPLHNFVVTNFPSSVVIEQFYPFCNNGTYQANGVFFSPDLVHPNELGNSVIAKTIERKLMLQP